MAVSSIDFLINNGEDDMADYVKQLDRSINEVIIIFHCLIKFFNAAGSSGHPQQAEQDSWYHQWRTLRAGEIIIIICLCPRREVYYLLSSFFCYWNERHRIHFPDSRSSGDVAALPDGCSYCAVREAIQRRLVEVNVEFLGSKPFAGPGSSRKCELSTYSLTAISNSSHRMLSSLFSHPIDI